MAVTLVYTLPLSAQWGWGSGVKGKGPMVERKLELASFDAIKVTNSADVYIKQGNTQEVVVKAQENLIDLINTEVNNKQWKIKFDKNVNSQKGIEVYITIPYLTGVAVSGSGDVYGKGEFDNLDDLYIGVSGSGNINLAFEAKAVSAKVSGSGDLKLKGSASSFEAAISGSGDISAMDLKTPEASIRVSGSGDCSIHAVDDLDVRISGSGDVDYAGRPRVKSRISGSGDLESKS